MRIMASKVMARELMKRNTDSTYIKSIKCIEMEERTYTTYIDYDAFYHMNDYNSDSRTFKALEVEYMDGCCAQSQYITSNDLIKIFRNSDRTYNGFIDEVLAAYSI